MFDNERPAIIAFEFVTYLLAATFAVALVALAVAVLTA